MGVAWGGAYPLARILYGDIATDVAPVLRAMSFLFPLAFLYHFVSGMLQALSREKQVVSVTAVTVVVGVLTSVAFIPRYGIYGAVIARTLSELIGLVLLIGVFWPLLTQSSRGQAVQRPAE